MNPIGFGMTSHSADWRLSFSCANDYFHADVRSIYLLANHRIGEGRLLHAINLIPMGKQELLDVRGKLERLLIT